MTWTAPPRLVRPLPGSPADLDWVQSMLASLDGAVRAGDGSENPGVSKGPDIPPLRIEVKDAVPEDGWQVPTYVFRKRVRKPSRFTPEIVTPLRDRDADSTSVLFMSPAADQARGSGVEGPEVPTYALPEIDSEDDEASGWEPAAYVYRSRRSRRRRRQSSVLNLKKRRVKRPAPGSLDHLAWVRSMVARLDQVLGSADGGSNDAAPPGAAVSQRPGSGRQADAGPDPERLAAPHLPDRLQINRAVVIVLTSIALAEGGCIAYRLLAQRAIRPPTAQSAPEARPASGIAPARFIHR